MALTLEQIAVITGEGPQSGGPLLSRFAAAVRKVVAVIESEVDTTPNHAGRLAWAKAVFKDRKYNFYALYCMDLAATDTSGPLWAVGAQISDEQIEQVVQAVLLRVVKLTAP